MISIGKIVYNEVLHNHKELPYIKYQKIGDINVDKMPLPTLIVGWKLVNELIPSYPHDILERELELNRPDKTFWEFSPIEDIVQYTIGLENYLKRIPYLYISKYKYVNTDPFFLNLFTIDQLSQYLPDGGDLYIYKNEMAYYKHDDIIYGVKLTIYQYLDVPPTDVLNALLLKSKNHLSDDGSEYQKYYKQFPEFGLLKRSMVVFLFS